MEDWMFRPAWCLPAHDAQATPTPATHHVTRREVLAFQFEFQNYALVSSKVLLAMKIHATLTIPWMMLMTVYA